MVDARAVGRRAVGGRRAPVGPFGERLRAAREARQWDQTRLAAAAGISREVIGEYESELRYPSFASLDALCRALDLSPCYLMGLPCAGTTREARIADLRRQAAALEAALEALEA